MNRKRKGAKRAARPPAAEASVYSGSLLLGTIKSHGGEFVAETADGVALGSFRRDRDAMHAICNADRAARLATAVEDAPASEARAP